MKKLSVKILVVACVVCMVVCACLLTACKKNTKYFGEFGYKGNRLKEYATRAITASEAKEIIPDTISASAQAQSKVVFTSSTMGDLVQIESKPSAEMVDAVIKKYASCTITTKYYVEGKEKLQTKEDTLRGTDLKNMLADNQFQPFNQLTAKCVLVYDDLIDYMEGCNEQFKASPEASIAPFIDIFTYHADSDGNLIVQTHDFAEIPASVGGGIGCSYRQDTEIVYDAEGKMTLWQTSLGVYTATPEGTMKDGYILEMNVEWTEKN